MISKTINKALLLIFILLFFSGNPLSTFLFGKYSSIIGIFLTLIVINKEFKIDRNFLRNYRIFFLIILIIVVCQYIVLHYISLLGIFNILTKILLGAFIIWYLRESFSFYLFKVLGTLSFISLICFISINLLGLSIPNIDLGTNNISYIIHTVSSSDAIDRNAGMFWEPGAFAGVLTLCLALNLNQLTYYWHNNKLSLLSIITSLLTTQSTTGFLVGFLILIFVFLKPKHFGISVIIIPIMITLGTYVYETNDFLKNKIEFQYEKSQTLKIGDFSNSRFGSLIFDWHYIQKHPIIGNGLDKQTRYSDHLYLFWGQEGDVIGSGNSISHYWASMGLIFIIGYFVLLWKACVDNGKIFALLVSLVVVFNLFGEQWFNYPLFLGLPFLIFQNKPGYNPISKKSSPSIKSYI